MGALMTFGRRVEMEGGATSIASSASRACLASAACFDCRDDDDELEANDAHERDVVAIPSLSVTSISILSMSVSS
jgi:hypothetical protein